MQAHFCAIFICLFEGFFAHPKCWKRVWWLPIACDFFKFSIRLWLKSYVNVKFSSQWVNFSLVIGKIEIQILWAWEPWATKKDGTLGWLIGWLLRWIDVIASYFIYKESFTSLFFIPCFWRLGFDKGVENREAWLQGSISYLFPNNFHLFIIHFLAHYKKCKMLFFPMFKHLAPHDIYTHTFQPW